jgi:Mg-chelatase subunit ChlD
MSELTDRDKEALLRWRLALGPGAERTDPRFALAENASAGGETIDARTAADLDRALSLVYEERSADLSGSRPYIPEWLARLRELFSHDVVALVQKDAIERKGLTQLLFEPETLPFLERNVGLVATLISAKGLVPDRARDLARDLVREVVEQLRRKLEVSMRTAVLGAIRRDRTSPVHIARNIDWNKTIRANLKGWDAANKRIIPERFHFSANQRRRHEWDVVLAVDQSASMAESVVYSTVMAAIFASLDVLRTRLILFDTEVVEMTHLLVDPVELLFSAQLGGGTDINRAVAYAMEHAIERPEKTLLILISDLFEGGDRDDLLARLRTLVDGKVKILSLLALTDSGHPSFDHDLAQQIRALGIPCFGCTPRLLIETVAEVLA